MDDIKIIRLQSGEDVIASCFHGQDAVTLQNPMLVIFKRHVSGKAMMILLPWLPLEIIENNSATIYNNDILTEFIPKQSLVEYYLKSITDLEEQIEYGSEDLENDMNEEQSPFDELSFEEALEETNQMNSDKKLFH